MMAPAIIIQWGYSQSLSKCSIKGQPPGKSECSDRDGSTKRHFPKSRSVSWQMWRSETQKSNGRSDFTDCSYSRRRYFERLPTAERTGAARISTATRGVNSDPRLGSRLLDRH